MWFCPYEMLPAVVCLLPRMAAQGGRRLPLTTFVFHRRSGVAGKPHVLVEWSPPHPVPRPLLFSPALLTSGL